MQFNRIESNNTFGLTRKNNKTNSTKALKEELYLSLNKTIC